MYIMKLKPAFKDYLWGGTALRDKYGMECDFEKIAEAWVLSCHKDGESTVLNGKYSGLTLSAAIEKAGRDCLGTRGRRFEFFPVLIKLIDAKQNLSVQVHPSDEYALKNEHEYGKTEMWYVVDCKEGAYLYYGFNREISADEFRRRIEDGTLLEVLNKVPCKKGDCFFIKSGTIHAIGAGLLIAEIQQNSNTTYRVFDYGRVGADGRPRELHIEKALAVTKTAPPETEVLHAGDEPGDVSLARCDYFKVERLTVCGDRNIFVSDESFVSLLCTEGCVTVENIELNPGESVFIPAGMGEIAVWGNGTVIESRV